MQLSSFGSWHARSGAKILAQVETEDVVVDPVAARIGWIREEVEALRELHGVLIVIDDEIATNGNENAVGLNGDGGLAVDGDDLVLHFLERQFLCDGRKSGRQRSESKERIDEWRYVGMLESNVTECCLAKTDW